MIKYKPLTIKNKPFIKSFSDKGMKIERDGALYEESLDPAELGRKFRETDIPIVTEGVGE